MHMILACACTRVRAYSCKEHPSMRTHPQDFAEYLTFSRRIQQEPDNISKSQIEGKHAPVSLSLSLSLSCICLACVDLITWFSVMSLDVDT